MRRAAFDEAKEAVLDLRHTHCEMPGHPAEMILHIMDKLQPILILMAVCVLGCAADAAEQWNAFRDIGSKPASRQWGFASVPGSAWKDRFDWNTRFNALPYSAASLDKAKSAVYTVSHKSKDSSIGLLVWTAPRGGYYTISGRASGEPGTTARAFAVSNRLHSPIVSSQSSAEFSTKALLNEGDRVVFGAEPIKGRGASGKVRTLWSIDIKRVPVVPEPWTPVVVDANTVKCWNREYAFGSSLMPSTISSGAEQLLSKPIELNATVHARPDDVTHTWFGEKEEWGPAKLSVRQRDPDAVKFTTQAESKHLVAKCDYTAEFDGMVLCDLTITPKAGSASLREINIAIPFNAEIAKLYQHQTFKIAWEQKYGKDGTEPLNAGALPGYMGLPFVHSMWIGDEKRGLQWFAESGEGLSPRGYFLTVDKNRLMKLSLSDTRVISKSKPFHFVFGLMASPVKPMLAPYQMRWAFWWQEPSLWRTPSVENSGLLGLHKNGVKFFHLKGASGDPYIESPELPGLMKAAADLDIHPMASSGQWIRSTSKGYSRDMDTHPRTIFTVPEEPGQQILVCQASNHRLWLLDRAEKAFNELKLDGIYLDGTAYPGFCANLSHGCGYVDSTGTHATVPILKIRELMKQLHLLCRATGRPTCITAHMSGLICLPAISFADVYLDGEHIAREWPESDAYGLVGFRAEELGRQFGIPSVYLTMIADGADRNSTYAAIHGMSHINVGETGSRFWKATEDFGTANATWVPFWEDGRPITTDADLKISTYVRKPGGALSVIGNLTYAPITASIRIDRAALGLSSSPTANDLAAGTALPVADDAFTVTIGPGKYALVRIE